eukprot:3744982-Pyramimonas_sp.AAC.1
MHYDSRPSSDTQSCSARTSSLARDLSPRASRPTPPTLTLLASVHFVAAPVLAAEGASTPLLPGHRCPPH